MKSRPVSKPTIIFCADPLKSAAVDPSYAGEAGVAREAGFQVVTLDHDYLDRQIDPASALRRTRFDEPGAAIYRGWMMSVEAYAALHRALAVRSIRLLTSPEEYTACHHTPESYAALQEWMPETVWVLRSEIDDSCAIKAALEPFADGPVILKDWVKSQAAGYWKEACFIPDASDTDAVGRSIARFRDLQGESLVGGLVFKKYVPLLPVGFPAHELRCFIIDGRVVGCWPRSAEARAVGTPPRELLDSVAAHIPSSFASADFARDESGRWWLLEVGDGQVSGLPDPAAARAIFQAFDNGDEAAGERA